MIKNLQISLVLASVLLMKPLLAEAKDLGFRFDGKKCVNDQGVEGLNPSIFGPCSDLRGVTLSKFDFAGIDFSGSKMTGSDFQKSSFEGSILVSVDFGNSNLNGVNFDQTKIENSNFAKSQLKNVTMVDADISFSNFSEVDFRLSDLSYVKFSDCQMQAANFENVHLDQSEFLRNQLVGANFAGTTLTSANFQSSNLGQANFSRSNLTKAKLSSANLDGVFLQGAQLRYVNLDKASLRAVNLRRLNFMYASFAMADLTGADAKLTNFSKANFDGATLKDVKFNQKTELPFSKEKAIELGMSFQNTKRIFILPDVKTQSLEVFKSALEDLGTEVNISAKLEYQFDGTEALDGYDVVIHMNATTYDQDMTMEGQVALNEFVKKGGVFIYGEWNSYEIGDGRMQGMRDLTLFASGDTRSGIAFALNTTEAAKDTPIFDGITGSNVTIRTTGSNTGELFMFSSQPAVSLLKDNDGSAVVAMRKLGAGTIVGFRFNCSDSAGVAANCLRDPVVQKLYFNAANF